MRGSGLWAGLSRLVLLLFSAVFVVSLVVAGLVAIMVTALWSLLRGHKPAVFRIYSQFRDASRRFGARASGYQSAATRHAAADVVDVDAHEVDGVSRLK